MITSHQKRKLVKPKITYSMIMRWKLCKCRYVTQQISDNNDYFGDISDTRSFTQTTYNVLAKSEPIPVGVGSYFDTVNDAHVWYKNYTKSIGFSVRKDELRHDGKSGEVASWRWVCSRQGYRLKKWMEKIDRSGNRGALVVTDARLNFE